MHGWRRKGGRGIRVAITRASRAWKNFYTGGGKVDEVNFSKSQRRDSQIATTYLWRRVKIVGVPILRRGIFSFRAIGDLL